MGCAGAAVLSRIGAGRVERFPAGQRAFALPPDDGFVGLERSAMREAPGLVAAVAEAAHRIFGRHGPSLWGRRPMLRIATMKPSVLDPTPGRPTPCEEGAVPTMLRPAPGANPVADQRRGKPAHLADSGRWGPPEPDFTTFGDITRGPARGCPLAQPGGLIMAPTDGGGRGMPWPSSARPTARTAVSGTDISHRRRLTGGSLG